MDNPVYTELKSFIYGDDDSSGYKDKRFDLPSFDSVVEKINSFALRQDLRIRIISESLGQIMQDVEEKMEIPFFLTSYLCRETVKSLTLRKFNRVLGCECVDFLSLSHKIGDNIAEANRVFSEIRICDPFARTGKFITAMLNELIAAKSQLGLLVDTNGNPLYKYKFVTASEGEGLLVLDKKDLHPVQLDGSAPESCHIQHALFNEKVALVRQCLFGVCVDPVSLLTCKIRLWLDMISHLDGVKNLALPPVESNLICGNALISRFTLKDDLTVALKQINQTVAGYKMLAEKIKTVNDTTDRQYLNELMTLVKNRLIEGIGWYSKDTNELLRLRREMSALLEPGLFPLDKNEKLLQQERLLLLQAKIKNQEKLISTFRNHPAFEQAIEWRYVFPELLDAKGNFTGFDAMIGILPDADVAGIGGEKANFYKRMNFKVFKNTGNISDMYCELASRLLVFEGCMTYIMSSNWQRDTLNSKIGEFLNAEMNPLQLILLNEIASSCHQLKDKCAIIAHKDLNRHRTVICRIDASFHPKTIDLETYVRQFAKPVYRLVETGYTSGSDYTFGAETISTMIASQAEYTSINNKIKRKGLLIRNWNVNIYSGIVTGCDQAFVINKQTRDELIRADYKNSNIIVPVLTGDFIKRYGDQVPEQWLLNIPWHFPLHYDKTINAASAIAEQRFQLQYTDINAHLLKYKDALSSRNTNEVGLGFEWYALQHFVSGDQWNDFSAQKIVWKRDSSDYNFGFDYGQCAVLDDTCFMVGQHLKYLLGALNSTIGRFMLSDQARQSISESQAGIFVVESVAVPLPNNKIESDVVLLVNRRFSENNKSKEVKALTDEKIDRIFYRLFDLTENEISFIKTHSNM